MRNNSKLWSKDNHFFAKKETDEETWNQIREIVSKWDAIPGPYGFSPRLHIHDSGLGGKLYKNELGWILTSYFTSNDKTKLRHTIIDLGYKIFNCVIDLARIGIATSITYDAVAEDKAQKLSQPFHEMQYKSKYAIAFGHSSDQKGILWKFVEWFYNDDYRLPIKDVLSDPLNKAEKVANVFTDTFLAPSSGNSQTRRLVLDASHVHFYTVSILFERWVDIGIAIAAFEMSTQENKMLAGKWEVLSSYPQNEGTYCISWKFDRQLK